MIVPEKCSCPNWELGCELHAHWGNRNGRVQTCVRHGHRRPQIEDQPPPVPNEERPSWELVIEDMQERDRIGRERYGTPLQVGNGRDSLVDAYQEALDLVVYLRTEIEARRRSRQPG